MSTPHVWLILNPRRYFVIVPFTMFSIPFGFDREFYLKRTTFKFSFSTGYPVNRTCKHTILNNIHIESLIS